MDVNSAARLLSAKFASFPDELSFAVLEGWVKDLLSDPRTYGAAIAFEPRRFNRSDSYAVYGRR